MEINQLETAIEQERQLTETLIESMVRLYLSKLGCTEVPYK